MNKKYKLTKTYPGSPEVGKELSPKTCVNEDDTNNYYWEGSWFNPKSFPEFWELVKEKDYEILTFKHIMSNHILQKHTDEKFANIKGQWYAKCGEMSEDECLAMQNDYSIHYVKRLSDNIIFTVNDELSKGEKIKSISLIDGAIRIYPQNSFYKLKDAVKAKKKPILITEDKVELFEGDKAYHICTLEGSWNVKESLVRKEISNPPSYFKYFTDKEKAEEYVLENKPRYSLNNIEEAIKACLSLGLSYKGWKEGFTTDLKEYLKK